MGYMEEYDNAERWALVKEAVFPILISQETASNLQNIVARPYYDFAVIYSVPYDFSTNSKKRTCTTRDILEWGINEEMLYKQAVLNLEADIGNYQYKSVETLVEELVEEKYLPESEEDNFLPKIPLYVLTNREMMFGAAILLNQEYLRKLSEGRNFFVIPSSIHEILILWEDGKATQDEINMVIKGINANLHPDEQLSSHSLYYDSSREELRIWKLNPVNKL